MRQGRLASSANANTRLAPSLNRRPLRDAGRRLCGTEAGRPDGTCAGSPSGRGLVRLACHHAEKQPRSRAGAGCRTAGWVVGKSPARSHRQRDRGSAAPKVGAASVRRLGFFFGGDAMRAGIYRVIAERLAPSMPAFGETLSCGQIWALFAHIEDF